MIKSLISKTTGLAMVLTLAALSLFGGAAVAQDYGFGVPVDKGLDIQTPVTPVGELGAALHHEMLIIITGITVFVLALLIWVILRYNTAVNKTPATFTHNSMVEAVWTIAPVIILIVIAVPSVKLLQAQEDFSKVEPDIVIKATGYQWYWEYEYPNDDPAKAVAPYLSKMIGYQVPTRTAAVEAELAEAGYPPETFKLATDTPVVVPVGATVVVRVTGADVIHSWAVPAFWVKADGVPGRANDTWFRADKEGVYFGQCSELCGRDHSFMPITVKVVSQEEYDVWLACASNQGVEQCETPSMMDMLAAAEKGADGVEVASTER